MTGVGRPLGPSEELIWRLVEAGSINFAMTARVSPAPPVDLLERALASVQARHPLLRATIDPAGPRFVVHPTMPVACRVEARSWTEVVEEELGSPFDWRAGPLLRARALPEPGALRLVLSFHHAVGDARSGAILVRDLLAECARGADPKIPPGPVPQPQDARIPSAFRGRLRGLAYASRRLLSLARRPHRPARDGEGAPLATRVESRALDAAALREAARGEDTTVHGALCAAMLLAMAEDAGRPVTMGCLSPMDVRSALEPPAGDEVAFLVSGVSTFHRVRPGGGLWDLARDVRGQIEAALGRGDALVSTASTSVVLDRGREPAALVANVNRFIGAATTVTNLGLVDVPETYGPWRLEELHFGVAGNGFPGTAAGIAVTTFAGRLTLEYLYGDPWLRPERALGILDRAIARLITY